MPRKNGFTLIELMIVVAIIGILAAIAIPKFAELIRKSGEGASKGNLGALRSAMSIYYGDMEGEYPATVDALTIGGKYLGIVPAAKAPNYHTETNVTTLFSVSGLNDVGGWAYMDLSSNANMSNVYVNCSHTDTKGLVWTAY
jgi:prepilin-type N-terminal cleavage/methylation domain-containing protein